LAGFNGVEMLQGLPRRLATINSERIEIGRKAAELVLARATEGGEALASETIRLTPKLERGDTMRATG
jgi:LacI family gluconate utilization system Gnt-I transcriptional repressor